MLQVVEFVAYAFFSLWLIVVLNYAMHSFGTECFSVMLVFTESSDWFKFFTCLWFHSVLYIFCLFYSNYQNGSSGVHYNLTVCSRNICSTTNPDVMVLTLLLYYGCKI